MKIEPMKGVIIDDAINAAIAARISIEPVEIEFNGTTFEVRPDDTFKSAYDRWQRLRSVSVNPRAN